MRVCIALYCLIAHGLAYATAPGLEPAPLSGHLFLVTTMPYLEIL
jgi:hypothetical protein